MIRLLYCSQGTPGMSDAKIQDTLTVARRNNKARGITGVLVHGGGMFMQVLEGPEQAVLRLYVKILDDPRHSDCQIIYVTPAKGAVFRDWSMGMINSDPLEFQHIAELRAHRLETVSAKAFMDVMRAFSKRLVQP